MKMNNINPKWWKETVIYQVYPRSFQDTDGDGIGDLPGILQRLDYIASLGIGTLWINPIFSSPGFDNGYDIEDYYTIQPEYGSMADLELLIARCHQKNIRIITDIIVNHTSSHHEWFRQACMSRDNPYYSYYHWWPAEKGKPPYRCGFFDVAGEAWQYNAATDSYYLHYFSPQQPDLNWENPTVRQELYAMLRFWLDKGFDGFRFDAITFISKDTTWPEITPAILRDNYLGDWGHYYAAGPRLHEYLQEMHRQVLDGRPGEFLFLGEAPGIRAEEAALFVGEDRRELHLLCHFDATTIGYVPGEFKKPDPAGYDRSQFRQTFTRWDQAIDATAWIAQYLGNHDQPRMVSRWGDDSEAFRIPSAKLLLTFLLTIRGTPLVYNGDEIAMRNIRFTSIDDYEDIETHRMYQQLEADSTAAEAFLRDQQTTGRDNGRTPFQWTAGPNAGFTTGKPWLKMNPDYQVINRETEEGDSDSVLHFFRALTRLRKHYPAFLYGNYSLMTSDESPVYAYTRSLPGQGIAVLLNFSSGESPFASLLSLPSAGDILVNNYPTLQWTRQGLLLAPWQALAFICR